MIMDCVPFPYYNVLIPRGAWYFLFMLVTLKQVPAANAMLRPNALQGNDRIGLMKLFFFAFLTKALATDGPTDVPTDRPTDRHTLL